MVRRGGYGEGFLQRFGVYPLFPKKVANKKRIWLQAVSVGELQAIQPIVDELVRANLVELVITTTTSTGYQIAKKNFQNKALWVGYFPLDFWFFSRKAWQYMQPDIVIVMEGELWAEHLQQAQNRKIPALLLNARMSDRSFNRYKKVKWVTKWIFKKFAAIGVSNEQDLKRFFDLNAPQQLIQLTGNLKLDVEVKPLLTYEQKAELREEMGFLRKSEAVSMLFSQQQPSLVLLGASTWVGEEKLLIEVLNEALALSIDCYLLLIPRHAERRTEITNFLEKQKLPFHLRSQGKKVKHPNRIYVADTTGEMVLLSQVADVAFIGKSLPPHEGGQTPIEAACLGIPMVMGPNMSNFRLAVKGLVQEEAVLQCENAETVKKALLKLLQDSSLRQNMAIRLNTWHQSNRGAKDKTLDIIKKFL